MPGYFDVLVCAGIEQAMSTQFSNHRFAKINITESKTIYKIFGGLTCKLTMYQYVLVMKKCML